MTRPAPASGTPPAAAWGLDAWAAFALALVTATSLVVRLTDEPVTYNNECLHGPDPEACYERRPGAGWPVPFLLDTPGVSVERQVSWGEDTFRPGPFWLDLGLWWLLALGVLKGLHRWRPPAPLQGRWGLRFLVGLGVLIALGAGVLLLNQAALDGDAPGWLLYGTRPVVLPLIALVYASPAVYVGLSVAAAAVLWPGGGVALALRRPGPGSRLQGPR